MSPRTLENTATGETYTFLQLAEETDGELLRLRWSARPGAAVGEHVHPRQEERFDVVDGELTVFVDGQPSVIGAGETATIPPGAPHSFANRGPAAVSAVLELRPALRMQEVFESLAGLARDGRARRDGLPRNPLRLAVFAHEFRDEIRGARPSPALQRLIVPPLAMLGRGLGFRAHDPRYGIAGG